MNTNEIRERLSLTIALKIKRFMRMLRRPFIRTRLDFSASLFRNENQSVPSASIDSDCDRDIKLCDIVAVIGVFLAIRYVMRAIASIFR